MSPSWAFPHVQRKHFLNPVIRIGIGDGVEFDGRITMRKPGAPARGPEAVGRPHPATISRVLGDGAERMGLHGPLADDPTARVLDSLLWGVLCWLVVHGTLTVPFSTSRPVRLPSALGVATATGCHDPAPARPAARGGCDLPFRNLADGNRHHHSESRSLQCSGRLLHRAAGHGSLVVRLPCALGIAGLCAGSLILAVWWQWFRRADFHAGHFAWHLDHGRDGDHPYDRSRWRGSSDSEGSLRQSRSAPGGPSREA